MKCSEAEELLTDYLDGVLEPERMSAVQLHLEGCAECAALAADASEGFAFLKVAKEAREVDVAVPPMLVRQILEATNRRPQGFFSRILGLRISGILQPRWVMSMAMAALSVVMIGRFWGSAEHTIYRAWDRTLNKTVKRYENLALVDNVQSQLDDWRAQLERK